MKIFLPEPSLSFLSTPFLLWFCLPLYLRLPASGQILKIGITIKFSAPTILVSNIPLFDCHQLFFHPNFSKHWIDFSLGQYVHHHILLDPQPWHFLLWEVRKVHVYVLVIDVLIMFGKPKKVKFRSQCRVTDFYLFIFSVLIFMNSINTLLKPVAPPSSTPTPKLCLKTVDIW